MKGFEKMHEWRPSSSDKQRELTGWKSMELTAYMSLLSLWHLNVKFLDCWASSMWLTATLPSIDPICKTNTNISTTKCARNIPPSHWQHRYTRTYKIAFLPWKGCNTSSLILQWRWNPLKLCLYQHNKYTRSDTRMPAEDQFKDYSI